MRPLGIAICGAANQNGPPIKYGPLFQCRDILSQNIVCSDIRHCALECFRGRQPAVPQSRLIFTNRISPMRSNYFVGSAHFYFTVRSLTGMKAALYARVSTKRQEKDGTIASQVDVLRKFALENNYRPHQIIFFKPLFLDIF